MKFHHIGIACKNIKKSILAYEKIGYNSSDILFDPIQNVNLCFLDKDDSPLLELVGSVDDNSPLNNILKKNGTSPYHTCYEVLDIEKEISQLSDEGYMQITPVAKAIAFDGRKICFLYNKDMGIIELLEKE